MISIATSGEWADIAFICLILTAINAISPVKGCNLASGSEHGGATVGDVMG